MENKTTSEKKYIYYSSLSTEELEKILKLDFYDSSSNSLTTEEISIILHIINQKSSQDTPNIPFDVEKSWDSFIKNYLVFAENKNVLYEFDNTAFTQQKKKSFPFSTKNVAALFAFFVVAIALSKTTIAHDLLSNAANWTKGIFWYDQTKEINKQPFLNDSINLKVNETFEFVNIPSNLLPTWIPEGLEKSMEKETETDRMKMLMIFFNDESSQKYMTLDITYLYTETNTFFEKDSSEIEIYEKDGVSYYIMGNVDTNTVIWRNGSFECQIDGTLSRDEIKKIINSIPSKE